MLTWVFDRCLFTDTLLYWSHLFEHFDSTRFPPWCSRWWCTHSLTLARTSMKMIEVPLTTSWLLKDSWPKIDFWNTRYWELSVLYPQAIEVEGIIESLFLSRIFAKSHATVHVFVGKRKVLSIVLPPPAENRKITRNQQMPWTTVYISLFCSSLLVFHRQRKVLSQVLAFILQG